MFICGIIIIVIAILMFIFPSFFLKLKTPSYKKSAKLEKVVRIWSIVCAIIGIGLLVVGLWVI